MQFVRNISQNPAASCS